MSMKADKSKLKETLYKNTAGHTLYKLANGEFFHLCILILCISVVIIARICTKIVRPFSVIARTVFLKRKISTAYCKLR